MLKKIGITGKICLAFLIVLLLASTIMGCGKKQTASADDNSAVPQQNANPTGTQAAAGSSGTTISVGDLLKSANNYHSHNSNDFEKYIGEYARLEGTFERFRYLESGYSDYQDVPYRNFIGSMPYKSIGYESKMELIHFDNAKFNLKNGDIIVVEGIILDGNEMYHVCRLDFKKLISVTPGTTD